MNTTTHPTQTDEARWRAVLDRDTRLDGAFVFGVRSTGIYCRPSCPARRPRRANVLFFPIPEAAEQAGFRSCRRCRPRETPPAGSNLALVRQVCALIEAAPDGLPETAELSAATGVSSSHLQRAFKSALGVTPRAYADALRLNRFKSLLREGAPLTDALYDAGYGSSRGLYERASSGLGMTPATYGRGGRGADIAYTVSSWSGGYLLVGATPAGVAAVHLGASRNRLVEGLRLEFPAARIYRDDDGLGGIARVLFEHLEAGPATPLDLPLDIRATAFQARVWRELRSVPPGQSRSYSEIAERIGAPRATRAVAAACASNPVALVIPCHRVVRKDGDIGGYRWGGGLKRDLLERERSGRPD